MEETRLKSFLRIGSTLILLAFSLVMAAVIFGPGLSTVWR